MSGGLYSMEAKNFDTELDLTKVKPYGDTMNDGKTQVNPSLLFAGIDNALDDVSGLLSSMSNVSLSVLSEMIDNQEVLNQQYEIVGDVGYWPTEYNEVVLVVDKNNELNKKAAEVKKIAAWRVLKEK